MASNQRAAQRRKAREPEVETEMEVVEVVPEGEEAQQQLNAVVIHKYPSEQGGINVGIEVVGDVQVTEVQTLIEAGLHTFRKNLGFSPSN